MDITSIAPYIIEKQLVLRDLELIFTNTKDASPGIPLQILLYHYSVTAALLPVVAR